MNLQGGQALVTGGAIRIGRAITESLLSEGVDVIVHFQTSKKEAQALSPKSIFANLNDPTQSETLIKQAAKQFGPIDILINNAAVFHQTELTRATNKAVLDELQPNLLAPLALIRGFARQARPGKIINLLDQRITSTDTRCIPYLLSKKGLETLTQLAALDLAPGICVNAIAPGAVLIPSRPIDSPATEQAGTIPLNRHPMPVDIANAVIYLLRSDVITGQTLFIDGGQHLLGD